jgi:uncharacterized protein YjbI with pentapeptide repeats
MKLMPRLLQQILDLHAAWVDRNKDSFPTQKDHHGRANLIGADLSGLDLRGVNLYGAFLEGANFYGTNLSHADLRTADLSKTNLCETNLYRADLRWACLCGATIRSTSLCEIRVNANTRF